MRVEPFRVEDIARFDNFGGQDDLVLRMPPEQVAAITAKGNHYSLFDGDRPVCCFGFVPAHDYRASAWSLLQAGLPHLFVPIHITIRRLLRQQPWARIETYVDPTSERATRWVRLLGFSCEHPLKPFFLPDGRAAAEWVFFTTAR